MHWYCWKIDTSNCLEAEDFLCFSVHAEQYGVMQTYFCGLLDIEAIITWNDTDIITMGPPGSTSLHTAKSRIHRVGGLERLHAGR